jgi:hypothetical protein
MFFHATPLLGREIPPIQIFGELDHRILQLVVDADDIGADRFPAEPLGRLENASRRRRADTTKREFRLINKKNLTIPVELYQRDESDGKVAREIALHFDQVAFGALTVIERADGTLHIADGGTRWNAAMHRADIGNVPCMVFSDLSDKEACDTFLRINLNRRKLTTPQQQHGELFAGHDLAIRADAAEKLFAQYGIGFDSLNHLRACLRSQGKAADTLIKIMPEFATQREH